MTEAEVKSAVELAKKHGLLIISDEIYEPFLYGTGQHRTGEGIGEGAVNGAASESGQNPKPSLVSPARFYENTLILRGFSKSHAMTGWRLGYVAGPEAVVSQMTKLQQYTFVCAPSPLQIAAVKALDVPMDAAVAAYKRKRDIVYAGLSKKFEMVKPEGAFYIFPKAPGGQSASDFVARAIDKNVLIIPGNVFSERDTHFRISYATTDEKLVEGCEVLNSLA
jgi:aspartate aminotransferase/aminotransferase